MTDTEKPLVTFSLFAFNQEQFIRDAIKGAFAQTYEPLEIILSDDCSTDRTYEIMQEMAESYVGPHKLDLNRNEANLGSRGIGLHVNRAFELSSGQLFVFAAGDDISLPNRTAALVETWFAAGKPEGSLHSAAEVFSGSPDEIVSVFEGNADFNKQSIRNCVRTGGKGVLGATHAITRSVYERFGPLPEGTLFEDRTLAFRSLLLGDVIYSPLALVKYRQHGDAITSNLNYENKERWDRWVNGTIVKYQTFRRDYEFMTSLEKQDSKVLYEIDLGLKRAKRSRSLVSNSVMKRLLAAWSYSSGMKISDKVAFILQRGGFEKTFIYRALSAVWKIKNSNGFGI